MGISVCVCRTVSVGAERGECVYKCAGGGASHTYLGPGMYMEVCECVRVCACVCVCVLCWRSGGVSQKLGLA